MDTLRSLAFAGLAATALLATPGPARAETFHTCAGFISTLPTTINTQGVWCLQQDVATAITSGSAITINANNVTIDCNGFKIGGLGAGLTTSANGVFANNRNNATVRNCNIRGFAYGVGMNGDGHLIEDNRFDGNTIMGILVHGDGSIVRRNQVFDTGGSTSLPGEAAAISVNGSTDVRDNNISDVAPAASSGNGTAYGIFTVFSLSGVVSGNRIRGLLPLGSGVALGIYNESSSNVMVSGNFLQQVPSAASVGVRCTNNGMGRAKDNFILGFATPVANCTDLGNNL